LSTLGDTDKKAEYVKNMDYLIDAIANINMQGMFLTGGWTLRSIRIRIELL